MSYSVAQNTTFLTVASIGQKIISFVYFTFVARMIGVGNTGQYFFAIAFTTIFTVIADFGLGPVLTREAAKYPEKTEIYARTIFWAKFFFAIISYGLIALTVNLLNYSAELKTLIYISGVTMFFDSLHAAFFNVFRANKNLIYESIGVVGSQFLTLIIGTVALLTKQPLYWLIIAYTIPSFFNLIYSRLAVAHVFKFSYHFALDKEILKSFLRFAVPFALAGIIGRLYSYSDSIIMSKMLGKEHLGWWSVPYKITFAFQFIPIALSTSVYPVMSALSLRGRAEIGALFEKAWRYLFTIVFPISFGLFVLAKPVILKLYGETYSPSIVVLQILLISLIFGYLSFITGSVLNATNQQKIQTSLFALALTINVVMNLSLMPKIGITGAALSALTSNLVLCLVGFYFARKTIEIKARNLLKYAGQSFWPAVAMAALVY
ncbi:MAG: flippase, partial [Patescibacteria group bacterium]